MQKIVLEVEGLTAPELHRALSQNLPQASVELNNDQHQTRGATIADPQIVTAIISAGSSLVTAFIVAYSTIKSAKLGGNPPPAQINIYTATSEQPQIRIPVENVVGQTEKDLEEFYPALKDLEPLIRKIQYVEL